MLRRWPRPQVGVIVVTDGGRILGLGDLGANGMGMPIGRLALYVACAGVEPARCLPVALDVGTNTAAVRDDPLYLGLRQPRIAEAEYDALVEEFVVAAQDVFPGVLVQFEDFANVNAFRLLARYKSRVCSFHDDIQGTGAMGLAAIQAALRITGGSFAEQRFLFFGAGEANIGIGTIVVAALERAGLSDADARSRCWSIDSRGLVTTARPQSAEHRRAFAQDEAPLAEVLAIVEAFRPTIPIGASGQPGAFTEPLLAALARLNDRPVIFALSNPTPKVECTAEQAYRATGGRAVFATGSPFAPVTLEGRTYATAQANNSYVFPGVGLAVLASGLRRITDKMYFAAADALAAQVTDEDRNAGRIFPPASRPPDLAAHVRARMYRADYAAS